MTEIDGFVGQRKELAKRKDECGTSTMVAKNTIMKPEEMVVWWNDDNQSFILVPKCRTEQLYDPRNPLLFSGKTRPHVNMAFPLCSDHLITLLQYNALRALAFNRSLISDMLVNPLKCDEEVIHVVPYPAKPELVPPTFLPTVLQQTIPHGDWIDCFPCPIGRDRLIMEAGKFDEDELWADCIGGLYEGFPDDEIVRRGIIAWSPSWSVQGWEMSEGFFRKWGWLVRDVPGMLEATNSWRAIRGEVPLAYDESARVPCG